MEKSNLICLYDGSCTFPSLHSAEHGEGMIGMMAQNDPAAQINPAEQFCEFRVQCHYTVITKVGASLNHGLVLLSFI